jgi:hypothetical protein
VSARAETLASLLRQAATSLISVLEKPMEPAAWLSVPQPGVWSIGKEAEHVAEAAIYHQWIVRLTIGEKVSSRRPAIERLTMTTDLCRDEAIERIRARTDDGERLLLGLTDDQLDLATRPPRARNQRLAETIERVLIGHYAAHRESIETKLRIGHE